MDLVNYGLREKYEQIKKREDKLDDIKRMIDWERLRPLLRDLFTNDTDQGGRPNYDEILMVKILFLQSICNIVDESMETEMQFIESLQGYWETSEVHFMENL